MHALRLTVLLLLTASLAFAAEPPQLSQVLPVACTAGESREITLTGARLSAVMALVFSHPGIQATAIEKNRWKVTVAANVPPGDYDVLAVAAGGFSNPRRFTVSHWPELVETPKNDSLETAQALPVPAAVSGTIDPGIDRDYYRFSLTAGQHVTMHCISASLDGGLLPALAIWGPQGEEFLHDDGRLAEPLLSFTAPQSGAYVVRVEESAYRKAPDDGYRLVVADRPQLVAAVPHGLKQGGTQPVTLSVHGGVSKKLVIEIDTGSAASSAGGLPRKAASVFDNCFDYRHPELYGCLRFEQCDEPAIVEQQDFANHLKAATDLTLPATVVGGFAERADVDWFRFATKKGETISIEAIADRVGRPLDLEVVVHDATGKPLQTLTDTAQPKGVPATLPLDSLDPQGEFKPAADGVVFLSIRDLYGPSVAGADRVYRLRIGPPREELAIVAMPGASGAHGVVVAPGGKSKLSLMAIRRGGHNHAVRVTATNLPPGVTAKEIVIDPKASAGTMTFEAAADAVVWLGAIELTAETELRGEKQSLRVHPVASIPPAANARVRLMDVLPLAVLSGKASK